MSASKSESEKLYAELQKSINDEKLYWIRNDAKIRAAVTSKNYDEFREIVAAAHLRALNRKDMQRKQRTWSTITDSE